MGKVVRTIVIIIIAFALASLFLYRSRLGDRTSPRREPPRTSALIEAEGQVSEVDEDEGRLVLKSGGQSITFKFDELTSITDDGESVSPSAITPGAVATVLYVRRNGRNRARAITLTHPRSALN
jgi:hypothetical protein